MAEPKRLTSAQLESLIIDHGIVELVTELYAAATFQRDYWDDVAHEFELSGDERGELEARRRANSLDLTLDGLRLVRAAIEPKS